MWVAWWAPGYMGGVTPAPTKEEKTEGAGGTPGTLPDPPDMMMTKGAQQIRQLKYQGREPTSSFTT